MILFLKPVSFKTYFYQKACIRLNDFIGCCLSCNIGKIHRKLIQCFRNSQIFRGKNMIWCQKVSMNFIVIYTLAVLEVLKIHDVQFQHCSFLKELFLETCCLLLDTVKTEAKIGFWLQQIALQNFIYFTTHIKAQFCSLMAQIPLHNFSCKFKKCKGNKSENGWKYQHYFHWSFPSNLFLGFCSSCTFLFTGG